jgi:predicted NBD/HSP70 family sugar kinase
MTLPLRTIAVEEKRYALGVDIGGTKIAAGVVTPDGRILRKTTAPTPRDQDHVVHGASWRSSRTCGAVTRT